MKFILIICSYRENPYLKFSYDKYQFFGLMHGNNPRIENKSYYDLAAAGTARDIICNTRELRQMFHGVLQEDLVTCLWYHLVTSINYLVTYLS